MIFSAFDVQNLGLELVGCDATRFNEDTTIKHFTAEYGSYPVTLATLFSEMVQRGIVWGKDNSYEGMKSFLVANHFLFHYPKNSYALAHHFRLAENKCRGKPVWDWIEKISQMMQWKICWDPDIDDPDKAKFAVTIDGVDFRVWEPKHPTLSQDKSYYSEKFKHSAVKYEIALSVFNQKCVWISSQHKGAVHDLTIFKEPGGLADKIPEDKLAVVDRGYKDPTNSSVSLPNTTDPPELNSFKTRARLRHETFNGRLKKFRILDATFEHTPLGKQEIALQAVATLVQHQIDQGWPLYDV